MLSFVVVGSLIIMIGYLPQGLLAALIGSGLAAERPLATSLQSAAPILIASAILLFSSAWASSAIRKRFESGPIQGNND